MPINVRYEIYDGRRKAPVFTTMNDRRLAEVERNAREKEGSGFYRLSATVTPVDATKPEQYLLLVYEVRQAQRRYFKNGRKKEDLDASLAKEAQLDKWNLQTQRYIHKHPGYLPSDAEAHLFFLTVQQWRIHWKEYFAYKRKKDADAAVVRERYKQCTDFEKKIDEYIKQKIFV